MHRVVLGELLHRRSRSLALLLGILVATTAFTVLTGTSASQRLDVRGTVARAFRGDYDVLVRPHGSRTRLERRTGQVQPNFLSGLFGGITVAQWHRIDHIPGVEVAAPIANLGYLLPTAVVTVDVSRAAGSRGRVLLRAAVRWRSDHGLTRVPDGGQYVYVTPHRLRGAPPEREPDPYRRYSLREEAGDHSRPLPVCYAGFDAVAVALDGPFSAPYRMQVGCFSRATRSGRVSGALGPVTPGAPRIQLLWSFPLLLSAIDPTAEARLTGLDRSVVAGRYLRPGDRTHLAPVHGNRDPRRLPVLAATHTFVDEQADIAVQRLSASAVRRWTRPFGARDDESLASLRFLDRQPAGPVVQRMRIDAQTAYRKLLAQMRHSLFEQLSEIWRVGRTRPVRTGGALRPQTRAPVDQAWQSNQGGSVLEWAYAPASARDTWFRSISHTLAVTTPTTRPAGYPPLLSLVGRFDADQQGNAPQPGSPPLTTLQPPVLAPRGAAASARLGGRPLRPNGNLGGYLAQPPALLTTLRAARSLGGALFPDLHPGRSISAVRVRVAGVTGIDPVSRERIRQAAQRIATRTGLDVDITAGASGAPTAIDLPAGRFGRPRLALKEPWIRKGVATRVLTAVDRKSVVLFALILVVCALFVANATSAAVRARRTELGVLSSLGWSTGRLFAVVLAEVAALGLAAGVVGGLLALPLAALVGVDASVTRAAAAVPAATLLALLAGLVPATRAARAEPIAAVRPAVLEARRTWRLRTLGALALINVLRTPGRTALGALSLAIGVGALTLLLAATLAFHDTLVGTLLGQAVAVDVRSSDYVAVIATVLLGLASVADVLFLNLRDRAAEFATLTATGWDEAALGRLLALEGLWIGAAGASAGALAGLVAAAVFAGTLPASLLATTLAAAVAGALLAGAAGLAPAAWLRRTAVVPLLAGE